MLNKNQSHKRNSWKYALIIPALIGFVFLFQIKVIAQEKEETTFARRVHSSNEVRVVVNKNTTDAEMKKDAAELKEKYGITLKCSKVKRNNAGEITGIKLEYKDKDGNKGVSQVDGKEPIKPIHFYKNEASIGFGSPKQVRIFANRGNDADEDKVIELAIEDSARIADNFDFNFDFDIEAPEAPEAPEDAESPRAPEAFTWSDDTNSSVIIKKSGDKKPLVIINGKVLSDEKEIKEALEKYDGKNGVSIISSSDDENKIIINGKDVMKIRTDAMANAKIQMKRLKPLMKKQMELAKLHKVRAKEDMERARAEMDASKPEMEKAKIEMLQAKEEMLKAKAEMDAAKAELEKARAELKNQKK